MNEGYFNNCTYKWKPLDKLTIDFQLIRDPTIENRYRLVLYDPNSKGLVRFIGNEEHPIKGELFLESLFGSDPNDKIVECRWSKEKQDFEPVRYRHDRTEPNSVNVALSIYSSYFSESYCTMDQLCSTFSASTNSSRKRPKISL